MYVGSLLGCILRINTYARVKSKIGQRQALTGDASSLQGPRWPLRVAKIEARESDLLLLYRPSMGFKLSSGEGSSLPWERQLRLAGSSPWGVTRKINALILKGNLGGVPRH